MLTRQNVIFTDLLPLKSPPPSPSLKYDNGGPEINTVTKLEFLNSTGMYGVSSLVLCNLVGSRYQTPTRYTALSSASRIKEMEFIFQWVGKANPNSMMPGFQCYF